MNASMQRSDSLNPQQTWGVATRIAFRFCAAYFVLYMLPAPQRLGFFDAVPGGSKLAAPLLQPWKWAVPWVGQAVFRLPAAAVSYASFGPEKARDYVQCALLAFLAVAIALIWSLLDRKSTAHPRLRAWVRLLIRAYLIVALLPFALDKIIPVQFPAPRLGQLTRRVGELTPAALLWTFMGASTPYQIIGGMAEMAAVALLVFRRTTALGAIVAAAVLSNVVAINFCYDLGVKLYSSHLLAMSLFLFIPQARALADLFVFHRATRIEPEPRVIGSRRLHWLVTSGAAACLIWFGTTTAHDYWRGYQRMLSWRNAPLYGIYDVESAPPGIAGGARWVGVVVQSPTAFAFERADRSAGWYLSAYDAGAHVVALSDPTSKAPVGKLSYSRPDGSHVRLDGTVAGEHVSILLRPVDPSRLRLVNHGFHWSHERPPSSE
jgi:hypothetical protein